MKILICGGRDFEDWGLFTLSMINILNQYWTGPEPPIIISGGARGADTMAIKWANGYSYPTEVYLAKWDVHGKKAGILRNIQMLQDGKPDLVVAFLGGTGTAHMVKIAKEAGIEVKEIL